MLVGALIDGRADIPETSALTSPGQSAGGRLSLHRFADRSDLRDAGFRGQETSMATNANALDELPILPAASRQRIDKLFAQWNLPTSPGCAVGVVLRGKTEYENFFGSANLEDQIPIASQTVFNACSAAKEFTALAIQLLVSSGKCQLDDLVGNYVSEISDIGHPITIRHLLNHTSGIRDAHELACALGARDEDVLTRADVLRLLKGQRTLNFEPGAQFLYSNSNYVLLGLVIERVSGESFSTFIKQHIFLPLGMDHSRMVDDHSLVISHRAEAYKARGEGAFQRLSVNDGFSADGGLFTTLGDMELWDRHFDGKPIGGADTFARQIEQGVLNDGTRPHYASGLEVSEYRGWKTIGHNGGGGGYRATFLRFPEKRLSVILLANVSEIRTDAMARKIADLVLEAEAARNDNAVAASSRKVMQISPALYAKYVGEYDFDGRFSRTFEREGDKLIMILPDGKRVTAWPSSETRFFFKELPGEVEFPKEAGLAKQIRANLWDQVLAGRRVEPILLNAESSREYAGDYYNDELRVVYRIVFRSGTLMLEHPKGEIPFVSINADAFKRDVAHSTPDYGESLVADTLDFLRSTSRQLNGFYLNNERMLRLKFSKVRLEPH